MDLKETANNIIREWYALDSINLKKLTDSPIDLLIEKNRCAEFAGALDRQLAFGESELELELAYKQFEPRFHRLREKIIVAILRSE